VALTDVRPVVLITGIPASGKSTVQDVVIGRVLADYVAAIGSRPLVVVVLTPRADVVARREAARRKTAYRDGDRGVDEGLMV
jgi:hypothetical protein